MIKKKVLNHFNWWFSNLLIEKKSHSLFNFILFFLFFTGIVANEVYFCECGRSYKHKASLYAHKKHECGKEPQFSCPHCPYKAKVKRSLRTHIGVKHAMLYDQNLLKSNFIP